MSNQFSDEYYEKLKETFADENISLEIDSIQFNEAFNEHLQALEYWSYNGHPSLTDHERNR